MKNQAVNGTNPVPCVCYFNHEGENEGVTAHAVSLDPTSSFTGTIV